MFGCALLTLSPVVSKPTDFLLGNYVSREPEVVWQRFLEGIMSRLSTFMKYLIPPGHVPNLLTSAFFEVCPKSPFQKKCALNGVMKVVLTSKVP